jgi:hypothetical protein
MNFIQTNEIKFRDFNPLTKEIRYFDLDSYNINYHNDYSNIQRYVGVTNDGTIIYEGDIIQWDSGIYSIEGLPDNVQKQANQTYFEWMKNRIGDYDNEANGWYKIMKIGVVLFYNGTIGVHNEINILTHQENPFYKATLYYGSLQYSKEYKLIGNVYLNQDLLK